MSVPEPFRSVSSVKFLDNFHYLRKDINLLLMRDFGLKTRTYDVSLISEIYDMDDEDRVAFEGLSAKYELNSYSIKKYPEWQIELWRSSISSIMDNIGINIELGNSIRIDGDLFEEHYRDRNHFFCLAIGYCHALKDKFHEITLCTDAKLGNYAAISEKLKEEIDCLKGVQRANYRVYMAMKSKFADRIKLPPCTNASTLIPEPPINKELYYYGNNINSLNDRPNGLFGNATYLFDSVRHYNIITQKIYVCNEDFSKVLYSFERKSFKSKAVDFGRWKEITKKHKVTDD